MGLCCVRRRRRLRRRKLFTFSTSQKLLLRFFSNLIWRYPRWMSTKFVKIGGLPLFSEELWVI